MRAPTSRRPLRSGGTTNSVLDQEAAMPDEYVLRLEASGEVTTAQPDESATPPEPEEVEQ